MHEGLVSLVAELRPEVVLATGDLAHRGTAEQLAEARAVFADVDAPLVAVPGNHDIPYRFPSRFTSPWALFEASFGSTDPVYSSDALVDLRSQLRSTLAAPVGSALGRAARTRRRRVRAERVRAR